MVKACRKHAGLSQRELAEYAEVGKTVIYDIEHAKPTIKLETVYKIMQVLNIQISFKVPYEKGKSIEP